MIRAFCDVLEKNGYWVGLYTSRSVLSTHIEDDIKKRYALWVAEWGAKLNYSGTVGLWQYSEKGKVDRISGNVDLDIPYTDYPTKIKAKGLNGYGSAPIPTTDEKQDTGKTDGVTVTVQIGNETYNGTLVKV